MRHRRAVLPLTLLVVSVTACGTDDASDATLATVTHVVDGDTIRVEHAGQVRAVRLLNIDAPETDGPYTEAECLGAEAADLLRDLLPVGTEVRLEGDVEPRDRYGRDLAGVYVDDVLVNAAVARQGLAVPVLVEPNDRFHDEVVAAHAEARDARRGLYDPANGCPAPR